MKNLLSGLNPNKKKEESNSESDNGISGVLSVTHVTHVTKDLNWEGKPEDIFLVDTQVGKGAYGAVYKALLKASGVSIAAKQIQVEEKEATDIKKEIDILKICNHPSIVNYFGSLIVSRDESKQKSVTSPSKGFALPNEEGSHTLWILMDFCMGGSVKDLIQKHNKPLTEEQVAGVLVGALSGLNYLHDRNIIHRDLKAANILLTEDGAAKLADFGISTKLDSASTKAKTMIGTPYWMAPEVMGDTPYNNKIDIWSIGITAIEMAEMDPPNWDLKPFQLMLKLPKDPPPTLRSPQSFSKDFNDFITHCLRKDANQRPTAKQLVTHPFITNNGAKGMASLKELLKSSASGVVGSSPKAPVKKEEVKKEEPPKKQVPTESPHVFKPATPAKLHPKPTILHTSSDITFEGKWTKDTAGGCINHLTFRNNPQYFFIVKSENKVNFTLIQENNHHIGFYVAKTETDTRALSLNAKELIEKAKFQNAKEVSLSLTLAAGHYIVIPCTFTPAQEGSFKLRLNSGEPLDYTSLEGNFSEISSEWTPDTAGGTVNFSSWRKNPQFFLEISQDVTVAVQLESEINEKPHIGFYIVKAKEKKINISASEIVGDCKYAAKNAVSLKVPLKVSDGPFVVIPTTYNPGVTGKFVLAASGKGVSLKKVTDTWKSSSIKGEWNKQTAGGCKNFDTWANNPRFSLVMSKEETIVVVLSQSEKEKPHGIGFYVLENVESLKELTIKHDSNNKMIAKSKFVTGSEAASEVVIPKGGAYLIVPTTFQPGIEDKFELSVYSKEEFIMKSL